MYSEQSGVCGIIQETWRDISELTTEKRELKKECTEDAIKESSVTSEPVSVNSVVDLLQQI
jgi:hypothetical protein